MSNSYAACFNFNNSFSNFLFEISHVSHVCFMTYETYNVYAVKREL